MQERRADTAQKRPEMCIRDSRRGIAAEVLEEGLTNLLAEHGLVMEQVKVLSSIDLKQDEPAILALAEKYRVPFRVYTAEELGKIQEVTSRSAFVQQDVYKRQI